MLADGMGRRTNNRKGQRVGSLNTAGSTTAEGTMIPSTNTTNRPPRKQDGFTKGRACCRYYYTTTPNKDNRDGKITRTVISKIFLKFNKSINFDNLRRKGI